MTKADILRQSIGFFVSREVPRDVFGAYMNDTDGEGASALQAWVVDNMRPEITGWCAGIGIIEAAEHLYSVARENGNVG